MLVRMGLGLLGIGWGCAVGVGHLPVRGRGQERAAPAQEGQVLVGGEWVPN